MNNNPIGIFDSGIGGITIYEELHKLLPNESIIYLADSKNAPYGKKSKEQIIELSIKNTKFLLKKCCKLIVVACNTASTNAVKTLRKKYDIPFIRIQPAIKPAALQSKTKIVGILATESTLSSDLFYETSQKFAQGVEVIEQKGNGIVSLIESGKMHSSEMDQLLRKYLDPMLEKNIDNLVLGCTHYPFLRSKIEMITGKEINIIDSGEAIARQTKNILEIENLINDGTTQNTQQFYINKNIDVFQKLLDTYHKDLKVLRLDF
ncbi:MAG: glutamate racemase [Flavobacteriaceae bacterium]|nr:glutamate racemase [Flavobacteriaceae bacterium]